MTSEELEAIITKTGGELKDLTMEEEDDDEYEDIDDDAESDEGDKENQTNGKEAENGDGAGTSEATDQEIEEKFGLDKYDDEEGKAVRRS